MLFIFYCDWQPSTNEINPKMIRMIPSKLSLLSIRVQFTLPQTFIQNTETLGINKKCNYIKTDWTTVDYHMQSSTATENGSTLSYYTSYKCVKCSNCTQTFCTETQFFKWNILEGTWKQWTHVIRGVHDNIQLSPAQVPPQHVCCLRLETSKTADTNRVPCDWLTIKLTEGKFITSNRNMWTDH